MRNLILILVLFPFISLGQNKYFVYLKDKQGTEGSIAQPQDYLSEKAIKRRITQNVAITEKDLPVAQPYLKQISIAGYKILGKSKWLNAVLVEGKGIDSLLALPFVSSVEGNRDIRGDTSLGKYSRRKAKFTDPVVPQNYGSSKNQLNMIGADTMQANGFDGTGVFVGVIDAGFPNVNTAEVFKRIRDGKQIKRTFNFVHDTTDVFRDHSHGTNVLSIMAGYLPGGVIGPGPGVDLALYVTEDAVDVNESKIEEVYWVFAAEDADSVGVDIIQSSLGYSSFSDPSQDYTYAQMDGKSTIIVKAANQASALGILVVISAGNEGNTSWHYISSPADGENVIAVAAVNINRLKASFSSFGPSADGRIKPDISAMGVNTVYSNSGANVFAGNGTSYSSPLISGFLAGLKQQFPTLTALQLREVLLKSGDQYKRPDESFGYGIPSYNRAVKIIKQEYMPLAKEPEPNAKVILYPNPVESGQRMQIQIDGVHILPSHEVSVVDTYGRKLITHKALGTINFSDFIGGLYYLQLEYKGKIFNEKFIIQR